MPRKVQPSITFTLKWTGEEWDTSGPVYKNADDINPTQRGALEADLMDLMSWMNTEIVPTAPEPEEAK